VQIRKSSSESVLRKIQLLLEVVFVDVIEASDHGRLLGVTIESITSLVFTRYVVSALEDFNVMRYIKCTLRVCLRLLTYLLTYLLTTGAEW